MVSERVLYNVGLKTTFPAYLCGWTC